MFVLAKNISQSLLITAFTFTAIGFLSLITFHWGFTIFGALGCFMLSKGFKKIPADPPSVGLLTMYGKRIPVVIKEGITFVANYFPVLVDVIIIEVKRKESDYEYTGIRCKSDTVNGDAQIAGGEVNVKVSITHEPDYRAPNGGDRLIQYINSGKQEGADHILQDVIGKYTRNIASLYTWEQFTFLKASLEAGLLMQVADTQFKLLPRNRDGTISEETFDKYQKDPDAYEKLKEKRNDTLEYLKEVDLMSDKDEAQKETERKVRQREIETFLRIALINGGGDVWDIGARISRLNVVYIKVQGELEKDADITAREKKIAEGLKIDTQLDIDLANMYVNAAKKKGQEYKFADALQAVRIDRQRAQEIVVKGGGALAGAAAVMGASKGGK